MFRRASEIKSQKIVRKDKTLVVTVTRLVHGMHDIFIDEYPVTRCQFQLFIQRPDFNLPLQHINELQILVPVHDQKTRIFRITAVIDDIQHQIRKTGIRIQIDRIDKRLFPVWNHSITLCNLTIC